MPRIPMTDLGETIHGDTWPFDFRTLEPRPDAPTGLLVLLHGVGGDETQLAGVGARAPGGMLVALPRGQRSISGGRLGWHREGLSEDGPQTVESEAEEARTRLVEFIARLQDRYDIAPARTFVAGFSQGGGLAASAALTAPAGVAGFAVLCGRILPEIEPLLAPREALSHLQALVVHGRDDDVLPVEHARETQSTLARLGIDAPPRLHGGGHALTDAMEDDFLQWLARASGADGSGH